jgi:hypothetical protein
VKETMKKISAIKLSTLFVGILAANAASAAFGEGYWKVDFYDLKTKAYSVTQNACLKADKTFYFKMDFNTTFAGHGMWISQNGNVFVHGNWGNSNEYSNSAQMSRVDSTHGTGYWQQWTAPGISDVRNNYSSNKWTFLSATCPPTP